MLISGNWQIIRESYRRLAQHGRDAISTFASDRDALEAFRDNLMKVISNSYEFEVNKDTFKLIEKREGFSNYVESMGLPYYYNTADSMSPFMTIADNFFVTIINMNGGTDLVREIYDLMGRIIALSNPNESEGEGNEGMVSYYKNFKSRDRNGKIRKTKSKFARVVNTIFPGLPEAYVDALNDVWKDSYGSFDSSSFHFHEGRTSSHFCAAYENENTGPYSNITTTVFTKSIANSCMQYNRDDDDAWTSEARYSGMHCVEAYATSPKTGERYFEILYLTDSDDPFDDEAQVYARTLFSRVPETGHIEWGPIYVCSNIYKELMLKRMREMAEEAGSLDILEETIRKIDTKDYNPFTHVWHGALLRAIDTDGYHMNADDYINSDNDDDQSKTIVSPYIDVGPKAGFPVIGKDGMLYVGVLGSEEDRQNDDRFIDSRMVRLNEDSTASTFSMEHHQGVNYLPYVETKVRCEVCGNSVTKSSTKRIDIHMNGVMHINVTACESCLSEKITVLMDLGHYVLREDMKDEINVLVTSNPTGHDFISKMSEYCDEETLHHVSGSLVHQHSVSLRDVVFSYSSLESAKSELSPDYKDMVRVDDVHSATFKFENSIYVPRNKVVELEDRSYWVHDSRLALDLETLKLRRNCYDGGHALLCTDHARNGRYVSVRVPAHQAVDRFDREYQDYVRDNRVRYHLSVRKFLMAIGIDYSVPKVVRTKEELDACIEKHMVLDRSNTAKFYVVKGNEFIPSGISVVVDMHSSCVQINSSFNTYPVWMHGARDGDRFVNIRSHVADILGDDFELVYLPTDRPINETLSSYKKENDIENLIIMDREVFRNYYGENLIRYESSFPMNDSNFMETRYSDGTMPLL